MKIIKSTVLVPILLLLLATPVCVNAAPVEPKQIHVESKAITVKSRGNGPDENISEDSEGKNSAERKNELAPPPQKSRKQRGTNIIPTPTYSVIHAENQTPWFIKIYFDGKFKGTVPPWGDLSCTVNPAINSATSNGSTRCYARADFDDNSFKHWGPVEFKCEKDQITMYTWHLTREN